MSTTRYLIETPHLAPDTVVALLSDFPFTAFTTGEARLDAYLPSSEDSDHVYEAVCQLAARFELQLRREQIPDENWNARWEADYQSVEIDDWLRIRAPFHTAADGYDHELIILPEMSFGTGHHHTTYMLAEMMRHVSPFGKTCFDFGCGTGILAILAAKLGAQSVVATDIDQRCVDSTRANAARNHVQLHQVSIGTEQTLPAGPFDLIMANINRGVLVKALPALAERLSEGGEIWLSGVLESDRVLMKDALNLSALTLNETVQREKWLAMRTTRTV